MSSVAGRVRAVVAAPIVLSGLLCAATATMVWLGYRSTIEWQRSDAQVLTRRVSETLALVSSALNRDMKGAHGSILSSVHLSQLLFDATYDIADEFGRAFARFPYPESFFAWTDAGPRAGESTFFNRADRLPAWWLVEPARVPYPVLVRAEPAGATPLIRAVRDTATPRRPFVVQHAKLGGAHYQVVSYALYAGDDGADLAAIIGYTVNLDWVRQHYFGELLRQVTEIAGDDGDLSVMVLDEQQRVIAIANARAGYDVARERTFPLSFYDPSLVSGNSPAGSGPLLTLRVAGSFANPALGADSARRMFMLMAVAAGAIVVGLVATMRASRSSAQLAALKSEFVSTVTHEIKTPVSGIHLVAEALASGRCTSPDTVREYGTLLSIESRRLTQLIENLLAYARLSDVKQAYTFEAVEPGELVDEALARCGMRIAELGFKVDHAVPNDLPRVRADRSAIVQVLENILDNAVNYSDDVRAIEITGRTMPSDVELAIRDRGRGISPEDMPHVFDKFFRGRQAPTGGSGLGLTIARRIARDHGGDLHLESAPGKGTTVRLVLPAA